MKMCTKKKKTPAFFFALVKGFDKDIGFGGNGRDIVGCDYKKSVLLKKGEIAIFKFEEWLDDVCSDADLDFDFFWIENCYFNIG